MQPWKSKRVENKRNDDNGRLSNKSAQINTAQKVVPSSISKCSFRPADATRLQSLSKDLPIELISSPSRGIDASYSTRDLTNHETQAKYRDHISLRLKAHSDKFGPLLRHADDDLFPISLPAADSPSKWIAEGLDKARLGSLQDILLLVRRLREGCVAASRQDDFTVDVYALSTSLSMLVGDDIQLGSSLPRLIDLYGQVQPKNCFAAEQDLKSLLGYRTQAHPSFDLAHCASLYLLWLSVLGGQVARIGGAKSEAKKPGGSWLQERGRIMKHFSEEERDSPWIAISEEVHAALVEDNVFRLRKVLVEGRCSVWQKAIVRRSVERMRGVVWSTLTKAYMHAPLDGRLLGGEKGGEEWLERMLFIDTLCMPLPRNLYERTKTTASIPESWDDTADPGNHTLQSTSQHEEDYSVQIRASRLAAIFEAFHLSESPSNPPSVGPLARWTGRQVLQAGMPNLKLR